MGSGEALKWSGNTLAHSLKDVCGSYNSGPYKEPLK